MMNEEPPKDLATRAFQMRVLDEFAALRRDVAEIRDQQMAMARLIVTLDERVTSVEEHVASTDHRLPKLEEKVDARLQETRPIWEAVQTQLQRVVEKFDVVLRDIYDVRIDVTVHGRRIGELERRAS